VEEPELPEGITPDELDDEARRDLRGLQKDTADVVAKHLVAAGMLVDEDPGQALAHARYARRRASRIAVVREAAGIAAYHAGEWNEALGELRAARRMGGGPGHLAVMADIERALGRPERALELVRAPEAKELGRAETIELAIVAAGARRDLGELDAAVVGLQIPELEPGRREPWSPRLFYAYADNLLAAGRESDALQWFVHTVDADPEGETDAAERIADLTGEPLDDDGVTFQGEHLLDFEDGPEPDGAAGIAPDDADGELDPTGDDGTEGEDAGTPDPVTADAGPAGGNAASAAEVEDAATSTDGRTPTADQTTVDGLLTAHEVADTGEPEGAPPDVDAASNTPPGASERGPAGPGDPEIPAAEDQGSDR
jgi:tetratricopeptide (TPR) repeat protein